MLEWVNGCVLIANIVAHNSVEGISNAGSGWLQTYGQLVGVAIGTILTGVVAVSLAVMNNRSSDHRLRMQQTHDLQRENQRVTRERLEELYVLAGHWTAGLAQFNILGLRLAKGMLTYKQYVDLQLQQGEKSKVELSRMELLRDVYGSPALIEAAAAVEAAQNAWNSRFHPIELIAQRPDRFREVVVSRQPASEAEYAELDQLAGEVGSRSRALLAAIATQVKS
ncbi:hypothetical protein [Stenotrophomonas maltophilia]